MRFAIADLRLAMMGLVLMLVGGFARGEGLGVKVGWGGLYRVGDWTPVWVTVPPFQATEGGTEGVLEVWAYQDSRVTVGMRVPVALQGREVTYCVPMIMGGLLEGQSVVLRDSKGKVLASKGLGELPAPEVVAVGAGTSGAGRLVVAASESPSSVLPGDFIGAGVRPAMLPVWAEVYESLDLLVFNGMTLAELSTEQGKAIADWVKRGGRLVVGVPVEGLEVSRELSGLLPGSVGELEVMRNAEGGGQNGVNGIPRRKLVAVEGAKQVGEGLVVSRGLGEVFMAPFPLVADTRGAYGEMVGQIRPRVSTDLPVVEARSGSVWPRVFWGLAVVGLLAGLGEAMVRRAHDEWPWRVWVVVGVFVMVFGTAGVVVTWPKGKVGVERRELVDVVGGEVVARTAMGDGKGLRFPVPVLPGGMEGTDHAVILMGFADGAPAVVRGIGDGAFVGTLEPRGEVPAGSGAEVVRETARGIATGDGEVRAGVLPERYSEMRRLTPWRSTALQRAVQAGEMSLVWSERGGVVVREARAGGEVNVAVLILNVPTVLGSSLLSGFGSPRKRI